MVVSAPGTSPHFGAQARRAADHRLIEEILGWLAISTCSVLKESPSSPSARIDVVAVQECRDNVGDLYDVLQYMGKTWQAVTSDASGNNERMVFLYDLTRVIRLDEMGQIGFSRPRWWTGSGSTG